jgi:hypothetical protein
VILPLSSLIGLAFAGTEQIHTHAELGMNSNLGIFAQTAVYAEHRIFGALGKNSHLGFQTVPRPSATSRTFPGSNFP